MYHSTLGVRVIKKKKKKEYDGVVPWKSAVTCPKFNHIRPYSQLREAS